MQIARSQSQDVCRVTYQLEKFLLHAASINAFFACELDLERFLEVHGLLGLQHAECVLDDVGATHLHDEVGGGAQTAETEHRERVRQHRVADILVHLHVRVQLQELRLGGRVQEVRAAPEGKVRGCPRAAEVLLHVNVFVDCVVVELAGAQHCRARQALPIVHREGGCHNRGVVCSQNSPCRLWEPRSDGLLLCRRCQR